MISLARRLVSDRLVGAPEPLFTLLPGNVDQLPCFVIGRPTIREGDPREIVAVDVPVFVLGRTARDDEAQHQLDELATLAFTRLWGPWRVDGAACRLTDLEPGVIEVAGLEVPAYTVTVAVESTVCP